MDLWVNSIIDYIQGRDSGSGYGLQLFITLSSHPNLDEYSGNVKEYMKARLIFKRIKNYKFEMPKGNRNYPTVIIGGNQSADRNFRMSGINNRIPHNDSDCKLKEAVVDETYYGKTIYIYKGFQT